MLDLKARLKNKYFWISMISLIVILLEQLGIELPVDVNAIGSTILAIGVTLGILVDNSTEGFLDNNNNGIDDREE